MTKVAVSGAVIVFLVFFAVTSPDHAANIVHSAWHALVNIAHGIGDFINKLGLTGAMRMPALMPSELPEVARTKHHWIVLLRLPSRWHALVGVLVFVLAVIWPLAVADRCSSLAGRRGGVPALADLAGRADHPHPEADHPRAGRPGNDHLRGVPAARPDLRRPAGADRARQDPEATAPSNSRRREITRMCGG